MIHIHLHTKLNTSPSDLAIVLLEHEHLSRFFNAKFDLVKKENPGERSGGKGTVRQVSMGGHTFREVIVSADEAHICYRIEGQGPVTEHQGDIRFKPLGLPGSNETLTQLDYRIRCKGPRWIPEAIVTWVIKRDIKRALDKLARHFA